ncbi:MAG: hypothetical protein LC100_15175 [Chitinophagales bacterium]|nr:hypothetical protein [Chitinophagales bacterium]
MTNKRLDRMTEYTPDSWVIVKIESEQHGTIYKVLAGWSGSYLYGSSWKLSSGIVTFVDTGSYYESLQDSGSVYMLHKSSERMSSIMAQTLSTFELKLQEVNATIEVVKVQEVQTYLGKEPNA